MTYSTTFIGLAVAASLHLLGTAVYRLYFHPLARIPGPRFAALTKWYEWYVDIFEEGGGRFSFRLEKLHEQYGPIVRIRPNEIHVDDPTWYKTIYTGPGPRRDKDPDPAQALGNADGTIATIEHSHHRRRRNAIMPFFSANSVRQLEGKIKAGLERYADRLEARLHSQKPLDLRVSNLAWASDSLTDCIWALPTHYLATDETAEAWFQTWETLSRIYSVIKQSPWVVPLALRTPIAVLNVVWPSLVPIVQVHRDVRRRAEDASEIYRRATLDTHASESIRSHDMFQSIFASRLPDDDKNVERIAHEGFELLAAGSITVAKHLTSAMYHVLARPEVCKQLEEELCAAIPNSSSLPSIPCLRDLPWLSAIVKETLRATRLIRFRMPLIAPNEDLYYGDLRIPAGTSVSMNTAFSFANPELYAEPLEFRPERWLEKSAHMEKTSRYFKPFGLGARNCIGMHFAEAELHLALAMLFRRFDLKLFDTVKERDVDHQWSWITGEPCRETKGIRVLVKGIKPERMGAHFGDDRRM